MGRRHELLSTPCGEHAMDLLSVYPGVRPVASGSSLAALAPNEDAVGQVRSTQLKMKRNAHSV